MTPQFTLPRGSVRATGGNYEDTRKDRGSDEVRFARAAAYDGNRYCFDQQWPGILFKQDVCHPTPSGDAVDVCRDESGFPGPSIPNSDFLELPRRCGIGRLATKAVKPVRVCALYSTGWRQWRSNLTPRLHRRKQVQRYRHLTKPVPRWTPYTCSASRRLCL